MAALSASEFPQVQGGGSLMIAWQIRGKTALVVGGGEVAAGRILHLLNADALVTVICPSSGLNAEVAHRIALNQVRHVDRVFVPSDLATDPPPSMVLVAIDSPSASSEIWRLCKSTRIPANIADVPPECDFFFGSVHRDGPIQIMVSTNGKGPRLASAIRKRIAAALPENAGRAVESAGVLRARLREVAPGADEGPKRMRWIVKVSDAFSFEELCALTDEDVENLLLFYPAGTVPTAKELVKMRVRDWVPVAKGDDDADAEELAGVVEEKLKT